MYITKLILTLTWLGAAVAWDGDELEVFDVVEEVNQNFYTMLGVDRVSCLRFIVEQHCSRLIPLHD